MRPRQHQPNQVGRLPSFAGNQAEVMFIRTQRAMRGYFLSGLALLAVISIGGAASGQTTLPEVVVSAPKQQPKPKPRRVQVQAVPTRAAPAASVTPAAQLNAKADTFDAARSNLYTTIGTTSSTLSHATVEALPGSTNTPVERLLLNFPGVSQDSAVSGDLHVRNDHANVQYRIPFKLCSSVVNRPMAVPMNTLNSLV